MTRRFEIPTVSCFSYENTIIRRFIMTIILE